MPAANDSKCFIGIYPDSQVEEGFLTFSIPADREYTSFQPYALDFSISRRRYSARWKLKSTSILLLGGHCDLNTTTNSSILQAPSMVVYPYDLLPELAYVFTGFPPSGNEKRVDSMWLNATYAVTVVTAWLANALYMQQDLEGRINLTDYGGTYSAVQESIISVRPSLKAMPLLYMVLAVHPAITLIALLTAATLYHVPIGRGFGVVSILSGLEQSSLQIIRGAGFSGHLRRQVGLQIMAETSKLDDEAKMSYHLTGASSGMMGRTYLQSYIKYS